MRKPDSGARCLPYPAIEKEGGDWPHSKYAPTVTDISEASISIAHNLIAAPFLDQVLEDGKAEYGCLVSVPAASFRKLYLSTSSQQEVPLNPDVLSGQMLIRPMILAKSEIKYEFKPDDGVASIWQGGEVVIPMGARLALHDYMSPTIYNLPLLEILPDDKLPEGTFEVEETTLDGFYFRVTMARKLADYLQHRNAETKEHCDSISTHIASRCFEILQSKYSGQDDEEKPWKVHQNLASLSRSLKEAGLPLWDKPDFAPAEIAAKLHPHEISAQIKKVLEDD